MEHGLCPHCNQNLVHQTLVFVRSIWTNKDSMRIERSEYKCPLCAGLIMVTGGRIIKSTHAIDKETSRMNPETKRTVVCLCGSTKFHEQYAQENMNETMKGNIVLSCGVFGHTIHKFLELDEFDKEELDLLHKDKILMADEILVLDVDGYIGKSTSTEIEFAKRHGKVIRFLNKAIMHVPCPNCEESKLCDLTTDGSDGEFGWQEYSGYCNTCYIEIYATTSDRSGGTEIKHVDDDHEDDRLVSDDERLTEYYEQQRRNRRYEEVETDE